MDRFLNLHNAMILRNRNPPKDSVYRIAVKYARSVAYQGSAPDSLTADFNVGVEKPFSSNLSVF